MAYGLKYSQYITRGGATLQIRVYEKNYNGTAYGMAHITGAALQIIGGQSDPLTPIIKTAFSWSLADCWDEGATQADGTTCVNVLGEKCGQWEEFHTPDATKFRVELWATATAAATPACIWTGYVTPDSWSENLIYRGSVTITARDMLGALQDKEFNLTGRVSILDIVQGALSACAAPMALSYVAGHFLVNSNGSSILSHTIAASTFSGKTWQTALQDTLESLGLVLRYNGRNGLILATLRYVREDTLSGIHSIEFANRSGLRELAPALRSITETFDVDLVNIPAEDPEESQFTATGSNLTQVVVAHAAGGGTFTNTNYIPGYTITEAGGEGWSGGLASPQLGTPIDGAPDRRMYFPTDVQEDVTAVWNGPRLRGSFAFRLDQDGPIVWWTSSGKLSPFLGDNGIKQIELQVTAVVDNVTRYLSQSGSWGTTEQTIIYELGEEVSVPDSGGVGVKIVVKKVVSECSFPAYNALFVALNLVLEPTTRGASVITEYKTTTEYDLQNNVTITRHPAIGCANFSGCVDFFENVLALGAAIAPDEWNWPGESSYYPLAVMIQAQVLCYHAAAASVFTGTALDKTANAALPFPGCAYNYYQRECIQLSGTFDFAGGVVSQMNIREVYSWASVWGASFAPEYTQKSGSGAGSTSATGSGGSAANSGSGGYTQGGTAYWEMGENTACVQLKPAYNYLGPRKGLVFGRNASADANVDLEVVNIAAPGETPRYALHSSLPFYSDSFVSAGGLSTGGGTTGIDALAMWRLLTNNQSLSSYDDNTKIAGAHIPDMASAYGYATQSWVATQGYLSSAVTSLGGKTGAVTLGGGLGIDSSKVLSNSGVRSVSVNGDSLRVNTGGTDADLTVPYATTTQGFKRIAGTAAAGGYDLNTLLSGGGVTSNYSSVYYWANGPANMSYGSVLQVNSRATNGLALQLAWDVVHVPASSTYGTGKLWWRDSTYHDSTSDWGSWHLIYDDSTLTKSVLTNLLDDGAGTYVKRVGDSMSGDLTLANNVNINALDTASSARSLLYLSNSNNVVVGGGTRDITTGGNTYIDGKTIRLYTPNASSAWTTAMLVNGSQNVTIGASDLAAANYKLYVDGASYFAGAVTLPNAVAVNVKDSSAGVVEALLMSSADELRVGYGQRTAGITSMYGKTLRFATADTTAGPDIYIGGNSSSSHNKDAASVYFNSYVSQIRNGIKVSAEHVASADRLNLSVYTSNNATSPYAPSWNKTLEVTYDGKVNIGAPSTASATVNVNGMIWASTGIWSNGYVSGGGLSSSSDKRLKRGIKDFDYSAELLMALRPREWDWNELSALEGHAAGFIAQEVEPLLPYAVKERTYKQMVYETFHAVAFSALQDHETRIQDHETRILALERENRELKDEIKRLRAI